MIAQLFRLCMFVWLYASNPHRLRLGDSRKTVPAECVYTLPLRAAIVEAENARLEGYPLSVKDQAADWVNAFADTQDKVHAVALLSPTSFVKFGEVLDPREVHVKDFWNLTRYRSAPLLRLRVLEILCLRDPTAVRLSHATNVPKGLFFNMSQMSFDNMITTEQESRGVDVQEVVRQWSVRHDLNLGELLDDAGRFRIGIVMPYPHCLLCTLGKWDRWLIPACSGRLAAGLGLFYAPLLTRPPHLNIADAEASANAHQVALEEVDAWDPLTPETLQSTTDELRRLFQTQPTEQLAQLILWLERRRESALRQALLQHKLAYEMEFLMSCLILSGFLSNVATFGDVLRFAIVAGVQDPSLRAHISKPLLQPHSVPSTTTLRRHQLIAHMGFCLWEQGRHGALVRDGCVRYGTVDSSPQGPQDWVLHGARTIAVKDLVDAMVMADKLCEPTTTSEEKSVIVAKLEPLLAVSQGVPTAVGSGRQALHNKVHAVAHSVRLVSPSWQAAAALLNTTMTWTGDNGVESGFWLFKMSMRQLFGPWVVDADVSMNGDPNQPPEDLLAAAEGDHGVGQQFDFDEPLVANGFEFDDPDDPEPEQVAAAAIDTNGADPYMVDMTNSIFIPGLLHILHNTTSDLQVPLHYWPTFIEELRQVTRMLSRRWSKARLLETCFALPPQSFRKSEIASFRAPVYEGRWGSIWKSIGDLLDVMDLLRFAWSRDAFSRGRGGAQEQRQNEHSVKVEVVDSAIRSDLFWAYCVMLDTIGECFECMARWGESCPCHSEKVELKGMTRWKRGRAMTQEIGKESCPMRSLRAPCCANGEHFLHLRDLTRTTNNALLLNPYVSRLSAIDRAIVLGDFARSRQHVQLCLQIRMSFWQQLPHVLFGIAHFDKAIAVACAGRALALFDSAADDVVHHPLTLILCARGGVGGEQLRLFASRQRPLGQLPFLETQAAKFKFAPVVERWVESRHALLKRSITSALHVTATYVAYHGVQLPLRSRLTQTPTDLAVYARCCSTTRNPVACLKVMGLWQHPRVLALRQAVTLRSLNRHHSPALTEILYHVDPRSLHAELLAPPEGSNGDDDNGGGGGGGDGGDGGGGSREPLEATDGDCVDKGASPSISSLGDGGRGGGSGAASSGSLSGAPSSSMPPGDGGSSGNGDGRGSGDKQPPSKVTVASSTRGSSGGGLHDELWCKAAFDFFCSKVAATEADVLYSLGPQLTRVPTDYVLALSSFVNPEPSMPVVEEAIFEFDDDDDAGRAPRIEESEPFELHPTCERILFFSVQKLNPHQIVAIKGAPKVSDRRSLAVNVHNACDFCAANRDVRVSLESSAGGSLQSQILTTTLLSVSDFESLRVWSVKPELYIDFGFRVNQCIASGFQHVASELIKKDKFVVFASEDTDGNATSCLKMLESRGLAQRPV